MRDSIVLQTLYDRRADLLQQVSVLEDQKQLILLNAKTSQITPDRANALQAEIAGKRSVADAVLASTESIIAEVTAGLPLELRVSDIVDIVRIFEAAFAAKTIPQNASYALDRLRTLARLPVSPRRD
jgi:hypothetical protein